MIGRRCVWGKVNVFYTSWIRQKFVQDMHDNNNTFPLSFSVAIQFQNSVKLRSPRQIVIKIKIHSSNSLTRATVKQIFSRMSVRNNLSLALVSILSFQFAQGQLWLQFTLKKNVWISMNEIIIKAYPFHSYLEDRKGNANKHANCALN